MSAPTGYRITTDLKDFDLDAAYEFVSQRSYWARGMPRDVFDRGVKGALCFAIVRESDKAQVGFARVITDRATFAYMSDVYVLESERGRGLSKWLVESMRAHPELQGLRRWLLATKDAHALYRQFGFKSPTHPDRYMEIVDPDVYGPRR